MIIVTTAVIIDIACPLQIDIVEHHVQDARPSPGSYQFVFRRAPMRCRSYSSEMKRWFAAGYAAVHFFYGK